MTARRDTARTRQGSETRRRILDAAIQVYSEGGYQAGTTRQVAARAGIQQGLLTHHFPSKEELWKAAAGRIFEELAQALAARMSAPAADPLGRGREAIRSYVRFAAAHPELFRMMVGDGRRTDSLMIWLVTTHVAPLYRLFCEGRRSQPGGTDEALLPFAFHAFLGASSLPFAVAPQFRELSGLDPLAEASIERHADYLARLFLPERREDDDPAPARGGNHPRTKPTTGGSSHA